MKYLTLLLLIFPGIASAQFRFEDITRHANIDMQSVGELSAGPGVVVFDLNGDGWDDFYMSGGYDSDKIYLNMQDGTFKNVTPSNVAIHLDYRTYPRGGSAFDYNNDGFPDLYLCCNGRDILWRNNGDGTFTDVTRPAQLNFPLDKNESNSSTFGDFDGDGDNDIYVGRWVDELNFVRDAAQNEVAYAHKGFPNWLYVNNGNGTFTENAKILGVEGDTGCTNIALFFDYDRDGDLDILVGNDFGVQIMPNRVFKNMLMETGKATFVDMTDSIGLDQHLFCMGIGPNDFNRDGKFDFYETSIGPERLMQNMGGAFKNVGDSVGISNGYELKGSYMTTTWTALMSDFDNDGWEDGFIVHGYIGAIPPWETNPNRIDTCQFAHNIGGHFEDYTLQSGVIVDTLEARGAAYLDVDHDGKLDIAVASHDHGTGGRPLDYRVLHNVTPSSDKTHWLEMRFNAVRTAKEGIGTIVDVWAGGIIHSRQVSTGGGFGSQNSLMQHVGLGEFTVADSIVVYWPCDKYRHRTVNRYYNVPSDQILHFTEDTSATSGTSSVASSAMQQIKVYPTPAHNTLKVENLEASVGKRFEIFDLLGIRQLDVTGSESTFSLSIGGLKPGCYTLRITSAGSAVTKQFVKE
ncbi:MAG: FG-GAP-like repeat-containing protein [Bacteroidota bacterium]|nr:FG-GAP-like repeat-containing protein [Bacteroidota bacterium]